MSFSIEQKCPEPSAEHEALARARQGQLTKPAGSLGVLEEIAITLAALQGREKPRAEKAPVVLFAGDHGVTAEGISAYPSAVTVQMLANFASGGAAIAVLARELGVPLTVVDAGTLAEAELKGVVTDKPRRGTRNFAREAALTEDELDFALAAGRRQVQSAIAGGADLILFGEMGIGNTTSAAAVASALIGVDPAALAGRGTGLDDAGVAHKTRVIRAALALHGLDGGPASARRALLTVGGLEIVALAGAIMSAAQAGVPVLVDGFIVSVAALAAVGLNASVRPWLLFAHRSGEHGHARVLTALDGKPILDLGLRLGEGSGAATALSVIRLACAVHSGMATFAEAAVSERGPA
jgi:nicotinate-nucleotide--dimethylbenzimidazole phosphoribosyltransferase